ncbi:AAA family ATPase [Providencia sp. PROV092]|uniref:AAA family ATPase n=1 Tax=Providencia sp. PROV092 TaxID=2949808 RepID=UPI00234B52EC|nr:AAA family ATPase [Providencia sp. PROV092]
MISLFSGKNYKAFDNFELEIKPITVLLGANSCGKSALINALLMLSQSIDTMDISESALRLNGKKVGMGEALNLIKNKSQKNQLSFSFNLTETNKQARELTGFQYDFIETQIWLIRSAYFGIRQINDVNFKFRKEFINSLESAFYQSEKFDIAEITKKALFSIKEIKSCKNKLEDKEIPSRNKESANYIFNLSQKKLKDSFLKLTTVDGDKIAASTIEYNFDYNEKKENISISGFKLLNNENNVILNLSISKSLKIDILSDVFDEKTLNNSKGELKKHLDFDSLSLIKEERLNKNFEFARREVNNPVVLYLLKLIYVSVQNLVKELKDLKINHVSPLRAFPQRYYLLDKSIHHNQLNSLDGTELAEVLKKNPNIKKEINRLLSRFRIAIDIERVNDIIHKITVNQDTVSLELTDVGFGISQVLPILVQAMLSPKDSITIIEQPEIHLHPNMQAWLTDALIDIALKQQKFFIIETHSDTLIRRIRLRIVDKEWSLTENDIAIYHLEKDKSKSRTNLNRVLINSVGELDWPIDFMDVEIQDTIEYQRKKSEKILSQMKGENNA